MKPDAALEVLRDFLPEPTAVGIVLGSGLAGLEDALHEATALPFDDVPGLPGSGVAGHSGRFVFGWLEGIPVLLQAGRIHAYEGHPLDVVVAPVRLMAALGVETLLMTNAVGGIHPLIDPGNIVLVDDQINLTFRSPLAGPVLAGEPRFPDMSAPFDSAVANVVRRAALRAGLELKSGTYAGVLGPAYETAAEVEMLARLGGDVVGMSTVPEVIAAAAVGVRCAVLSLVTNKATGRSNDRISHEDVLARGTTSGGRMVRLVSDVVAGLAQASEESSESAAAEGSGESRAPDVSGESGG